MVIIWWDHEHINFIFKKVIGHSRAYYWRKGPTRTKPMLKKTNKQTHTLCKGPRTFFMIFIFEKGIVLAFAFLL